MSATRFTAPRPVLQISLSENLIAGFWVYVTVFACSLCSIMLFARCLGGHGDQFYVSNPLSGNLSGINVVTGIGRGGEKWRIYNNSGALCAGLP